MKPKLNPCGGSYTFTHGTGMDGKPVVHALTLSRDELAPGDMLWGGGINYRVVKPVPAHFGEPFYRGRYLVEESK